MTFGERLRDERKRLSLSQEDFGAIYGVSRKTQHEYEKDLSSPSGRQLEQIAKVGADVRYIVTGWRDELTSDEKELIEMYRAASLASKAKALTALTTAGGESAQQTSAGGPQQNVSGGSTGNQFNAPIEGAAAQHFNGPVGNVAGRDVNIKKK